ncbi:hypothetical protein SmJEL517_g01673 [Synchytrium microbalum]|uniref:Uncharacterized protein n=1 Tax=Synchytrium microbalum TaxID=1806994 RepID=A0A507C947_9FUNG|nr:uncharacterized protein SmJEL517_g01673 [Synchytrium microbalum]TPX35878.1 hypothetical protein SmJEL517_g01673 [Synchytrium microbalum]
MDRQPNSPQPPKRVMSTLVLSRPTSTMPMTYSRPSVALPSTSPTAPHQRDSLMHSINEDHLVSPSKAKGPKNPFDQIYNTPSAWSQGAFVTAAVERKKKRRVQWWLILGLALSVLLAIILIVFFCFPRSPTIHVRSVRNSTASPLDLVKLQSNPAMASFNFSMGVRVDSSNYLTTIIDEMTCFAYHPLQQTTVIASSSFTKFSVPPQSSRNANSSLYIQLVSPASSGAAITNFLASCGLVGINSNQSATTPTTVGVSVVDRPRSRLIFNCAAVWTVGATTLRNEFGSTLNFNCPVHLEGMPNLNKSFVFLS